MVPTSQQQAAKHISNVLVPPFFSLLAIVLLLWASSTPLPQKLLWGMIFFILPVVLPHYYIHWLNRQGKVSGIHLPVRQERTIPYLISLGCIALAAVLLYLVHAPVLILLFLIIYFINTFVITLVNLIWKMSAHTMGAATPLVVLSWQFGLFTLPLYLLLILVGWARLRLGVHTPAQVVVGAVSGIILTWLQLHFLLPWLTTI